jgi:hypothetical protein
MDLSLFPQQLQKPLSTIVGFLNYRVSNYRSFNYRYNIVRAGSDYSWITGVSGSDYS